MATNLQRKLLLCTKSEIEDLYPLHTLVWHNDFQTLNDRLTYTKQEDAEKKDPRGRTPLMLAVTLNHTECVDILTNHGSNVNTETNYWSVVQEATATGNEKLLKLVLERRNFQREYNRMCKLPQLLRKLKEAPDFYVEMKWEFSSWMPLVVRMCPSDTYKVYKQGSRVRIDSTLVGFDDYKWIRGNISIIFEGNEDSGTIMEVDHIARKVCIEKKKFVSPNGSYKCINNNVISTRLNNPIVTSYMDIDKISFERSKCGMWGWRQDKLETINGYPCKVFSASNLDVVTKTRTEHMKQRSHGDGQSSTDASNYTVLEQDNEDDGNLYNGISIEEYFTQNYDLAGRDIGKTKKVSTKVRKFKANLYLCEGYPLSLQEQILPIVNLMASTSSHFRKLKDFIEMQLPTGFPVKIDIPFFHVLNTSITFDNIFAMERPVNGVLKVETPPDNKLICIIDDSLFEPPADYSVIDLRRRRAHGDEDDMLEFALENSFFNNDADDKNQVGVWDVLNGKKSYSDPSLADCEDTNMQKAIEDSLLDLREEGAAVDVSRDDFSQNVDESYLFDDLQFAIAISKQEEEERERRHKLDEETIKRVLEMSVQEK